MVFNAENILLIGSILILFSIIISKTGYRFGIPTLLLFLLVGMLFGSDGLGLQFNSAEDAQFIGMVALSIILFTGGMETKFNEIRPILTEGIMLSTVGVLLTTLFTGIFIYFISGWNSQHVHISIIGAMLLAATMSSTDSASVFNLLRSQKMNLKNNLRPTLELESGSNDPMAYMLTIILIQIITTNEANFLNVIKDLGIQFFFGCVIGYALGRLSAWIINRIDLSNSSLYPILLLSIVFFTFTITDRLHGNGYLAVYITGIVVGNSRIVNRKEINTFMNGMTWLFQIILFLTLGLLVNPHEMLDIAHIALLIGIFMIIAARPLSVMLCLLPFRQLTFKSKIFISWVGLRGAVPIIFATYPVLAHVEGSHVLFNIVFFITLLSLTIQGTTISTVAKWLHLDMPLEKEGNDFGVELPDEIDSQLTDITLSHDMLRHGNRLMDMELPPKTLVILIKRQNEYIIPNGRMELHIGDKLLLIHDKEQESPQKINTQRAFQVNQSHNDSPQSLT